MSLDYDETQEKAIDLICSETRLCIVTGSPGTGKTTILKRVLNDTRLMGKDVVLAAPTGKAAKRIAEVVGGEASTVHRLTGYNGETYNTDTLPHDVIILDESSMVDAQMMYHLMLVMKASAKLVLIGDADQLPSVGAGSVLRDLIESNRVPTVKLRTLHRSAKESWICMNAPKILAGEMFDTEKRDDFEAFEYSNPYEVIDLVEQLLDHHRNNFFMGKFQLLTPMNIGELGTEVLNHAIAEVLNPKRQGGDTIELAVPRATMQQFAAVKDRVIHIRNNYRLGVLNGEIGTVDKIANGKVHVRFPEKMIEYPILSAMHELRLAYALTIHKCVAPSTLVETSSGLQIIDSIEKEGMIGTVIGMRPYAGFVRYEDRDMIMLRTEHGYEIEVTTDHGMMMWDGDMYSRVLADEIKVGNFLRLKLGAAGNPDAVELPSVPYADVRASTYQLPSVLTKDAAEFLGLMVADGTVYKAGFRLKKRHRDVCVRFAELCEILFGKTVEVCEDVNCWSVTINSTFLSSWLQRIPGLAPNMKAVPLIVLRSPLDVQAAFLRGLYEDGGVNLRNDGYVDHVEWSTAYEEMSRIVQVMLLRQNIISSRFLSDESWRVDIYGGQIEDFKSRIGFISAYKNEKLTYRIGVDTRKLVPVSKSWVRSNIERNHETLYDRQNALSRGYVSRVVAEKWGLDLDFHHDEVVEIEHYVGPAVCVAVPEHGGFLQNGFDGCNSQGSEWENVAVICHGMHARMWSRQLFYTAVTRAKKGVTLIGNDEGVGVALAQNKPRERFTTLPERIKELAVPMPSVKGFGMDEDDNDDIDEAM